MQIAQAEDRGQLVPRYSPKEPESAQVRTLLQQHMLAKSLGLDVREIVAVVNGISADNDEKRLRIGGRDAVGDSNENVEAAHRFQAAGNVGDDTRPCGDVFAGNPPWSVAAAPELHVHPVMDDVDFGLPHLR